MSSDSTPHHDDLDRLIAGEQDGLPPAPEGSTDPSGSTDPEERFVPPSGHQTE